jgi:hypothetical protein
MLYKQTSSGRTMDVGEIEATRRHILEGSGWVAVVEDEQPQAPTVEMPSIQPAPVDDLPEDFPERQLLTDAGYGALLLVSKATDDELRAIDGIGKGKLKAIRDYALHN